MAAPTLRSVDHRAIIVAVIRWIVPLESCFMLELRTLGALSLRFSDEGGEVRSVLARPKRVALLVYLTLRRPRGRQPRDRILSVFWPEMPFDRGRRALNQAVYVLRRGLGDSVILSDPDGGLSIDPQMLECDAIEFERLLDAGDFERGLRLYRGPLLDGLHLADAFEYERWLATERRRLQRRAIEAAHQLAEAHRSAGNPVAAVRWLRTAAGWAPYDEAVHAAFIEALFEAGDRAGAAEEHGRFVRRLQEDLELAPSAETHAVVQRTLNSGRTEGAPPGDPAPPNESEAPGLDGSSAATEVPELRGPPGDERTGHRSLARPFGGTLVGGIPGAVLLGVLLLVITSLMGERPSAETPSQASIGSDPNTPAARRFAVMPFSFAGERSLAYLGDGAVELLAIRLDGLGPLRTVDQRVLSRTVESSRAGLPLEVARRAAQRVDADLFLMGSVIEAGGDLWVHATLYDSTGHAVAGVARGGPADSLFAVVDGLVLDLASHVLEADPNRQSSVAARTTNSLPALQAYLAGEEAFANSAYTEALEAYRRAVLHDSTFALAWYRIARVSDWTLTPGRSPRAAQMALRYADRLPARERDLTAAWGAYVGDHTRSAERLYHRILRDYPDYFEAWYQLGEVLFHQGWLQGHRLLELRQAFERALELKPDHHESRLHLARLAAGEGNADEVFALTGPLMGDDVPAQVELEARLLRALSTSNRSGLVAALGELEVHQHRGLSPAHWAVFYAREVELADLFARSLLVPSNTEKIREIGRLALATLSMARGQRQRAFEQLSAAGATAPPAWAMAARGLFAVTPPMLDLPADLTDPDGNPEISRSRTGDRGLGTLEEKRRAMVHLYLEGLTAGVGGEEEVLLRSARELEALASRGTVGTVAVDLARALRASFAARSGDADVAWSELERIVPPPTYDNAALWPHFSFGRERFLRARLLEEAGRLREAQEAYAALGSSLHDLPYLAPSHLRRARIHEQRGNVAEAAEHYRSFVHLWREADQELQPLVHDARQRLDRLLSVH